MPLVLELPGQDIAEAAYAEMKAHSGFLTPDAPLETLGPFPHFRIEPEEVEENFPGVSDTIMFPFKSGDRYPLLRLKRNTLRFHDASGVSWVGKHLYEYIQRIAEERAKEDEPTTISFFMMPSVLISGIIVRGGASQSSYAHALCRLIDKRSDFQDFTFPEFFQLVAGQRDAWRPKYAEDYGTEDALNATTT